MYKVISLTNCRTIFALNYEDTHIFKFLKNHENNLDFFSISDIRQTDIYRYLRSEKKSLLSEYGFDFGVFNLPWGNFRKDYPHSPTKNVLESRFCGPSSDDFAVNEIHNIIKLFNSFKSSGWKKRYLPFSVVEFRSNDKSSYIMLGGNHRSIIAYYLGYKYAFVTNHSECFNKICISEVNKWYHVQNGDIPKSVALKVFNRFLE